MNRDLTKEFLVSLGFKEDGYTNLSFDYYLEKEEFSIFINLKSTSDKPGCIFIYNNDHSNRRVISLEDHKSYPRPIEFTVEDLKTAIKLADINFEVDALE